MRVNKLLAVLLAALVAGAMVAPAAAWSDTATSESVEMTVEVNDEWTTVTVEQSGSAVAGADVTVDSLATADVEAEGEYRTDAEGTVRLPTPDADATASVEIESENIHAAGTLTLEAYDGEERRYTVEVEAEGSVDAESETSAESDENGTEAESETSAESEGEASATAESDDADEGDEQDDEQERDGNDGDEGDDAREDEQDSEGSLWVSIMTNASSFSEVTLTVLQTVYSLTVDGSVEAGAEAGLLASADNSSELGVSADGEAE
ncbi:hypothetical protein BRC73_06295, partial [Halobacteriales archaeon QH_7_66_37]